MLKIKLSSECLWYIARLFSKLKLNSAKHWALQHYHSAVIREIREFRASHAS